MQLKKNICVRNALFFCILGNLLYFIFPFPAIVWRFSFVLLSLYCVYMNWREYRLDGIEQSILLFVFLNLLYFFVGHFWLVPSTTQIGNTLYALLAFIAFSYLGKKEILTPKFIIAAAVLIISVAIPSFYHAQRLALTQLISGAEDTAINASVIFLMLLPLVLIVRSRMISLILFCVCLLFLITGAKRGNIVSAIIPATLYIWVLFKENRGSFFRMLLFIVASIGIAIWLKDMVLADEYLLSRYEDTLEGRSSGRDTIYFMMWNLWYGSDSIIEILFGYGFDGTISIIHKRAHNDWLEILVDFGLIGIFCYISVFISFAKLFFKMRNEYMRNVLLSIISIWLFKTLFSMGFTDEMLVLMSIPFGCLYNKSFFTDIKI